MKNITTVRISKLTRDKLESCKRYKRETMDDLLNRLIKIYKKFGDKENEN